MQRNIRCGKISETGNDNLIAGAEPDSQIAQVDCDGAIGDCESMRNIAKRGDLALETIDIGPAGNPGRRHCIGDVSLLSAPKNGLGPRYREFRQWSHRTQWNC